MNKSSQSKDSSEMTVDVTWLEKYEKQSGIWRPHISSYCLPNLTEQVWLERHWSSINRAKVFPCLSSAASEKLSIKSSFIAKQPTASFMVNNRILKMPNIRTKKACIVAFPTIISWPWSEFQLTPGAEQLLYFITLCGISPSRFSSYYLNS